MCMIALQTGQMRSASPEGVDASMVFVSRAVLVREGIAIGIIEADETLVVAEHSSHSRSGERKN